MTEPTTTAPTAAWSTQRACLLILVSGTLWGCIGLFTRPLFTLGVTPQILVLLRNLGATALLGVIFFFYDRSIFRIRLRHVPLFLCIGVVSVLLFNLCYFQCQKVASLAAAAILLYTAPAFVVLFSAIFLREAITRRKLLALICAFLGCCFVSGVLQGQLSLTAQGLLLGLGSGLFFSTYTLFSRVALRHYSPFTVTFYTFCMAGLSALTLLRPGALASVMDAPISLLLFLGVIVISTVLPYLLYNRGLKALGDGGRASILASVEPLVASIVGILAFGEPMTLGVVLGLACILLSVYILR